ncbi:lytic murein transglycosylase [Phaeobacter sp.]|uniref:lytic murein transglycosylase n=1 Tax=Phaeobacter sp. TaxID=1902409 RepID=UPI0025EF5985|nr:lytic murein transglycosylase [Phaeobacter sp.]
MTLTRRGFGFGLAAFGLTACSTGGTSAPNLVTRSASDLPADLRPTPNAAYDQWVTGFQQRARAAGISQSTLSSALRRTGYLPGVIKRDRNQTEFKRSLEDYLSIAASDQRVQKGRAAYARHQSTLRQLEQTYGVAAEIITAIWGLESFYGDRRGNIPVISSTSTLAFDGRRGAFFEKQLIAALKILQNGDTTVSQMTGSWAGAMGHTQFIPTSYQAFAVDFTGDGRRDIWSDDPTDALASTAAYLAKNGWRRNLGWGEEVIGQASAGQTILEPQKGGPRFAVTPNFRVIKRYNNSDAYAIGVGHLADRIAGAGPLRTPFPPDQNGLVKAQRVELQERLTAKGFDTGGADGVIGPKSTAAIRAFQSSIGQNPTGIPSPQLLVQLR